MLQKGQRERGSVMSNELTSCKTCSKEVAKSAIACPHCGAKLKLNLIEKILLFIVVSWVAIYIYGFMATVGPSLLKKIS